MSKENITAQMRAELAGARVTADSIAMRLKGKMMGNNSRRRAELQRLALWGIEANNLTPVVVDKVHGLLEQLSTNVSLVTPQELALVRETISVAVAEEKAESGSGRLFLYDVLRERPQLQKVAGILLAIFMLTGCLALQDSVHAATATPDNATTLDLDDTEQSLDEADTLQPTQTIVLTLPTATKTPRTTTTPTPQATPTGRPIPTATPGRLEVQRVRTELALKVIPAGINIRTSPNGEIAYNTRGEIKLEFTGKTEKAGNYTWMQVKDGDDLLWVADLSSITEETTSVETYAIGGEISNTELVREAQSALDASEAVVGVYFPTPNSFPFAFRADGTVVAVRVSGEWQKTIITETESSTDQQENTQAAETETTPAVEHISYAEAQQRFPQAFLHRYVKNGAVQSSHLIGEGWDKQGRVDTERLAVMEYAVVDGFLQMRDAGGESIFIFDDSNPDEALQGWSQLMFESANGNMQLFVATRYNDPEWRAKRINPDKPEEVRYIQDITVGTYEHTLNTYEPKDLKYTVDNQDMIDFYIEGGYIDTDRDPRVQIDGAEALTDLVDTALRMLQESTGQSGDKITVKQLDGTDAVLDLTKPVKLMIYPYTGLKSGGFFGKDIKSTTPKVPYIIENEQMLFTFADYQPFAWGLTGSVPFFFAVVLDNNGGTPDPELTHKFHTSKTTSGIGTTGRYPELLNKLNQLYIDDQGRRILTSLLYYWTSNQPTGKSITDF